MPLCAAHRCCKDLEEREPNVLLAWNETRNCSTRWELPRMLSLLPSQPKEPCIQTKAERPFEAISADLGILNGTSYLITVDWYSGWPPVKQLRKLDTSAITGIFEDWFYEYGRLLRLQTDNGPQFRTKFDKWCKTMGIVHKKSSPIGMWNVL